MKNLIWLLPFGTICFATAAIAGLAMAYMGLVVGIPIALVGSVLGTGCLEKAAGAGFFPWKWQFRSRQNGQAHQNQTACEPARNVKGAKR